MKVKEDNSSDEKFGKRNYSTPRRFRKVWLETFSWIKEIDGRAFCMACERTLVNHLTHLKKHEENDRHIQKSLRKYFSGFPPNDEQDGHFEKFTKPKVENRSFSSFPKDEVLEEVVQETYMNDNENDNETTTVVFSRVDNPIELGEDVSIKWEKIKFRKELELMKKEHLKRIELMQDKHELEKRIMIAKHNLEMKILKQKSLIKS